VNKIFTIVPEGIFLIQNQNSITERTVFFEKFMFSMVRFTLFLAKGLHFFIGLVPDNQIFTNINTIIDVNFSRHANRLRRENIFLKKGEKNLIYTPCNFTRWAN
jgi:hypothetical protein